MKNEKQIASTELSFQPFWGKFVTFCIQNQFREMSESAFCLCRIFYYMIKYVILTAIMTYNIKKFILFLK